MLFRNDYNVNGIDYALKPVQMCCNTQKKHTHKDVVQITQRANRCKSTVELSWLSAGCFVGVCGENYSSEFTKLSNPKVLIADGLIEDDSVPSGGGSILAAHHLLTHH